MAAVAVGSTYWRLSLIWSEEFGSTYEGSLLGERPRLAIPSPMCAAYATTAFIYYFVSVLT